MKILVTGSSGNLGSALVEHLKKKHHVVGLDLTKSPTTEWVGSIENRHFLLGNSRNFDVILHTASLHAPHVGRLSRRKFVDVNISGTLNLLDLAVATGVKKFIYTSTTSIYGQSLDAQNAAIWVDEKLPTEPRDIYDITKLAAEQLVRDTISVPSLCLRVSRFWHESLPLRAVYRMYRGVDVSDLVAAHELAINYHAKPFDVFNISAQSPFLQTDLPELFHDAPSVIQRYFPTAAAEFARRRWQMPSKIDRVYDISKAVRDLSYCPKINFTEFLDLHK